MALSNRNSHWKKPSGLQDLKTFSSDLIKIAGVINNTVKCNDCLAKDFKFTVVEDGHRQRSGRDLLPHLGLSVNQSGQLLNFNKKSMSNQSKIDSQLSRSHPRIGEFQKNVNTPLTFNKKRT